WKLAVGTTERFGGPAQPMADSSFRPPDCSSTVLFHRVVRLSADQVRQSAPELKDGVDSSGEFRDARHSSNMTARLNVTTAALVLTISLVANAQWLKNPAYPIPKGKDGKPNLSAPTPRATNGRPDLSGVWQAEPSPIPELIAGLAGLDSGEGGLGEDVP